MNDNQYKKGMMPDYRGLVPGTFTMGNVVCGFIAILFAFEGMITTACWFIILAGFLDALDGKIARLSKTSSQFGVELDSLADFLSFGVAPAVIVYAIKLNSMGIWGWVISIVFIMASAYRLARFNILASTEEKKKFSGLPVPIAAFALVSYIIFCHEIWGGLKLDQVLISMIIVLAFLMVSQVEYEIIPEGFRTREQRVKLLIIILCVIAILFKPRLLLFPIVSLYILLGVVRELYRLSYKGVDRVTGPYRRRKTDREQADE